MRSAPDPSRSSDAAHALTARPQAEAPIQRPTTNPLEALYRLSVAVGQAQSAQEIYEAALDALEGALHADRAAILLFDPDGVIRFKAWRALSDHYRQAAEGHSPWTRDAVNPPPVFTPDVDDDPTLAALRPVIRDEGIRALGFIPLIAQGRLLGKFMVYYNTPHIFTEEEAQLARTIAAHVAFATERKQAEDENTRLLAEMQHQRERLDNIIANVPGVVWEAWGQPDAATQRIDFVSDYVVTMLGYTVQEWLSTPNFWLVIVHPDDKEAAAQVAATHFARGTGGINRFRWVCKDGRVLWIEAQDTIIRDATGASVGMRGVCVDVSDRVRLEAQTRLQAEVLQTEYERLATLIAHIDVALTMTDGAGRLILANDTWLRRVGLRRDQILGRRHTEFGARDTGPLAEAQIARVLATGEPYLLEEVPYRRAGDGADIYIDGSILPIRNADGAITGVLTAHLDVTEKVHARQQIEAQRAMLATVLEGAPIGIALYDRDLRLIALNTAYAQISHFDPTHAVGQLLSDLAPGTQVQQDLYQRVLAGEAVDLEDMPYQWDDSPLPHYYDMRYRPIRDASGAITGMISTTVEVTEQVRARQEIENQRALLETIVEGAPVGLAFFDPAMRVVNLNAEWARLVGTSIDQARGQIVYDLVPSTRDREDLHRRVLAGEPIDLAGLSYQPLDSTAICYYDMHFRPMRDAAGAITGLLSAVIDVTARQELDQQKDEFIALASHELKTPITAIKGYAQTGLRAAGTLGDARLIRNLRIINEQSDRLTRLVNELLDVSRMTSGALSLYQEVFDLRELIQEAVSNMELMAPGFTLALTLPPGPVMVNADRQRLEQVLVNLLQNAVKYSGASQRVEIAVQVTDDEALTTVRDFGIGIPPAQQAQVFERFFRASNVHAQQSGLGLGLFIAYGIVQRHAGRMWVESAEGAGSTFSFGLPLVSAGA